jgi:hypothetical protein
MKMNLSERILYPEIEPRFYRRPARNLVHVTKSNLCI